MKQTILSANQSDVLEVLIVKYGQIVTFNQIISELERFWDYGQAKNVITKLVKNGWLIRIKKGLYAISDLSSRGFLSLSPYVIANLLLNESYVSFESALEYHGMFDQHVNKIVSISTRGYKTIFLQNIEYSFVKTKPSQYFGWEEVDTDGRIVRIATAEKALIDMVNFHKSKYAIDLMIEKLSLYRNSLDTIKMSEYLSKFSLTTVKIFGLIFDLLAIDSSQLYKLVEANHGTHWMLPGDKKFSAKWRLYYDIYFDKYK